MSSCVCLGFLGPKIEKKLLKGRERKWTVSSINKKKIKIKRKIQNCKTNLLKRVNNYHSKERVHLLDYWKKKRRGRVPPRIKSKYCKIQNSLLIPFLHCHQLSKCSKIVKDNKKNKIFLVRTRWAYFHFLGTPIKENETENLIFLCWKDKEDCSKFFLEKKVYGNEVSENWKLN